LPSRNFVDLWHNKIQEDQVENPDENRHPAHVSQPAGVKRGDVVDIDDENAARYCALGYCEGQLKGEVGPPFVPAPLAPTTW
jgi:hypothetical protein